MKDVIMEETAKRDGHKRKDDHWDSDGDREEGEAREEDEEMT